MTIDQSWTPVAPDRGEVSSRFGWLSAEEVSPGLGAEADGHAEAAPEPLMPPPALPTWPRVYPGL